MNAVLADDLAANLAASVAEKVHPPRRRDLSFYIVLCLAVVPLWSSVPLSWAFVIYALRSGSIWSYTWFGKLVFAAALCEVFFSVYHFNLARFVTKYSPHPPAHLTELHAVFLRVLQAGLASLPEDGFDEETLDVDRPGSPAEAVVALDYNDPRAVDFRNYLRTWFGKVSWSSLRRQEMYTWLHWAIFNAPFTSLDEIPPVHRKAVCDVLEMIEKRSGSAIPEGSCPSIKPLRLTLDPVHVAWRPFFWYAFVALSNGILRRCLRSRHDTTVAIHNGLEYVLRCPPTWDARAGPRPIVFLHGLGLGLTQYYTFIRELFAAVSDRPILIPLHPHISQEIFHPRFLRPMDKHETVQCMAGLLRELGWVAPEQEESSSENETRVGCEKISKGVTLFSHSNGSFIHAWMLKAHPEMVTRSCFADPVTFCSWEGDLCYNFVYRPCTTGLELLVKYFVGAELGVANFLQRHFDWSANALWYEEIPRARDPSRTLFLLGGRDGMFDAHRVKRYLTSHGIRKGLYFDPEGRHGQSLLGEGHQRVMQWLQHS